MLYKPSWTSLKAAAQTGDNADPRAELLREGKAQYLQGIFSQNGLLEQKRYIIELLGKSGFRFLLILCVSLGKVQLCPLTVSDVHRLLWK